MTFRPVFASHTSHYLNALPTEAILNTLKEDLNILTDKEQEETQIEQ